MMSKSTLKEILIQFLREEDVHYPQTEITILSSNPFQFSDDGQYYFESQNLHEIYSDGKKSFANGQKMSILLKNWNFVFRRVPNTHDYYFDIVCDSYEFMANEMPLFNGQLKKVIADDAVKYAFEVRKRKLISQFIKNESGNGMDFGIGSGAKFERMLTGKNQSFPSGSKIVSSLFFEENIICQLRWVEAKTFPYHLSPALGRG